MHHVSIWIEFLYAFRESLLQKNLNLVRFYFCFVLFDLVVWDKVSLWNNPGCPRTHCVDQADFKLTKIHLPLPPTCWNCRRVPLMHGKWTASIPLKNLLTMLKLKACTYKIVSKASPFQQQLQYQSVLKGNSFRLHLQSPSRTLRSILARFQSVKHLPHHQRPKGGRQTKLRCKLTKHKFKHSLLFTKSLHP